MDAFIILFMVISVGISMVGKVKEQAKKEEQRAARQRGKGELSVNNMLRHIAAIEEIKSESIAGDEYQKREALKKELKQRAIQRHQAASQQQGSLGPRPLEGCYEAPEPEPLTGCYEESGSLGGQMKTEGDSFYNISNKKHIVDANYDLETNSLNLLTDIQKSIIMAEVLGKPKALKRM